MRTAPLFALLATFALALPACATETEGAAAEPEAVGQSTEALTERLTPRLESLGSPALSELERLYHSGTTEGGLPEGKAVGKALFLGIPALSNFEEELRRAGIPSARTAEDLIANVIWRGKTFHPVSDPTGARIGTLTNDVLGFQIATADIRFIGESPISDEANTFYLDYSTSNFPVVRGVQDYIRRIDSDLYIGKAFIKLPGTRDRVLACYFALDFAK